MADTWQEEEASGDEKLRIAQHFLVSSPPGQVHEVLRDVAKLVPPHILTESALRGALYAYNKKCMVPVRVPDADYTILICNDARIDATHYVDPIGRRVFGFDPIKQQLIEDDISQLPSSYPSDYEDERRLMQKALQAYLQFEYMHQGTAGVYVQGSSLLVNLCTERINLRNFYSGRWQSRWEIDLTKLEIQGTMQVHVHYFENGNLQLECEKSVIESFQLGTRGTSIGDHVVAVIKDVEDQLQVQLEEMYINMSQETFKEMRRVMPVTQTKMDWSLYAHRTAKDLTRK